MGGALPKISSKEDLLEYLKKDIKVKVRESLTANRQTLIQLQTNERQILSNLFTFVLRTGDIEKFIKHYFLFVSIIYGEEEIIFTMSDHIKQEIAAYKIKDVLKADDVGVVYDHNQTIKFTAKPEKLRWIVVSRNAWLKEPPFIFEFYNSENNKLMYTIHYNGFESAIADFLARDNLKNLENELTSLKATFRIDSHTTGFPKKDKTIVENVIRKVITINAHPGTEKTLLEFLKNNLNKYFTGKVIVNSGEDIIFISHTSNIKIDYEKYITTQQSNEALIKILEIYNASVNKDKYGNITIYSETETLEKLVSKLVENLSIFDLDIESITIINKKTAETLFISNRNHLEKDLLTFKQKLEMQSFIDKLSDYATIEETQSHCRIKLIRDDLLGDFLLLLNMFNIQSFYKGEVEVQTRTSKAPVIKCGSDELQETINSYFATEKLKNNYNVYSFYSYMIVKKTLMLNVVTTTKKEELLIADYFANVWKIPEKLNLVFFSWNTIDKEDKLITKTDNIDKLSNYAKSICSYIGDKDCRKGNCKRRLWQENNKLAELDKQIQKSEQQQLKFATDILVQVQQLNQLFL